MSEPRQGEIWWATAAGKLRPVLVLTRSEAIPVLSRVLVAPVTPTVREIPTEVSLGKDEGLNRDCVAVFDSIQPIEKSRLTERVGSIGIGRRHEICAAVSAALDC